VRGYRCEGDTLKDSLEYALKKFEDLSLYRDALDGLTDADWETLKVNQSEWLAFFEVAARLAGQQLCERYFADLPAAVNLSAAADAQHAEQAQMRKALLFPVPDHCSLSFCSPVHVHACSLSAHNLCALQSGNEAGTWHV
jgi:hypothetical protein